MANICTNPGFETNTTGWFAAQGTETLTRDTTQFHSGVASGKLVTPGGVAQEGLFFEASYAVAIGNAITTRCWLRGAGTVQVWAATVAGLYQDVVKSGDVALTGSWQQVSSNLTAAATATEVRIEVRTSENLSAQAVTFYVDDAEILVPDVATGGGPRNLLMMGAG